MQEIIFQPNQQPMPFAPLPESLALDIGKVFGQTRLQATMLDLEHLATLIRNGKEKSICEQWLHPGEQEKLQALRYEKRHLEWLGGRLCAKEVSLRYLHDNRRSATMRANHLQIMTAASGRPFVGPRGLSKDLLPHISISHSRRYALAVAASAPCGVDIQAEGETVVRVRDRFCSGEEQERLEHALHQLQPSARLTLLWAAKEAVKKGGAFERMPGFLDLTLTNIQTTVRDSLLSFAPGRVKEHPIPETGDRAHCLFTLEYQQSHQEWFPHRLQFQVAVCLHRGYGIALCVISSNPCAGVDNA